MRPAATTAAAPRSRLALGLATSALLVGAVAFFVTRRAPQAGTPTTDAARPLIAPDGDTTAAAARDAGPLTAGDTTAARDAGTLTPPTGDTTAAARDTGPLTVPASDAIAAARDAGPLTAGDTTAARDADPLTGDARAAARDAGRLTVPASDATAAARDAGADAARVDANARARKQPVPEEPALDAAQAALLESAERAFSAGNYSEALTFARRAALAPSGRARAIETMIACALGNLGLANATFPRVPPRERTAVRAWCRSKQIELQQ